MDRVNKEICLLGYAGALGCYDILLHRSQEFQERFTKRYIHQAKERHTKAIADSARALGFLEHKEHFLGEIEWVKVEDGGVLASIYNWTKSRNIGCRLAIKKIPLLQSGVEICEFYGLNIYRLRSDCFLIFTDQGHAFTQKMREQGFVCEVIGVLQDGLDKIIMDKEEIEYINRPTKDEIRKIGYL